MRTRDWLQATSASSMTRHLFRKFYSDPAFSRKLRLAGCACLRLVEDRFSSVDRQAIDLAERYADGMATAAALREAHQYYLECPSVLAPLRAVLSSHRSKGLLDAIRLSNHRSDPSTLRPRRAHLVREIFGDPFLGPRAEWPSDGLFGTMSRMVAGSIVLDGRFEELPVLADALEDDGYTNEQVLADLRKGGVRPRGCWSLDLVCGLGLGVQAARKVVA